jgi:carbon monoxide dehydrogenase subunit G
LARLEETITVKGAIDDVFAYVADFANSEEWDPGVARTERLTEGAVGVGSRYRVMVRFFGRTAPMEYEITEYDPPRRVVLTGTGSTVEAVDDIRFEAAGDESTVVHYTADIRLTGMAALIQPFLGSAFVRIGKKAMAGLERTLGTPS